MKIVVISTASLETPPFAYSGMERIANLIARGLKERGHDIRMIAKTGSKPDYPLFPVNHETEIPGVVTLYGLDQWTDVFLDISHDKTLSVARPELPIVNCYQAMSATGNSMNSVCISEAQHRVKMSHIKAEIINQLIDTQEMSYYGGPRDNYICYLGQRIVEKRLEWAMQIAILTGIPLRTFSPGWGDASYHRMLESLRDAHPDLITIESDIGGEEKLHVMQRAKALIHPVGANNWLEAGGIVVLEALSCGTPCLVSSNGCLPSYITDGVNGYVINSPEEGAQLLKVGAVDKIRPFECRLSAERFDYHVVSAQWEKLCERIVSGERW